MLTGALKTIINKDNANEHLKALVKNYWNAIVLMASHKNLCNESVCLEENKSLTINPKYPSAFSVFSI